MTAYQAGNEERIGTVKNQWYRQALAYYEMLCQKNDPSYEDRLGMALLLRVLGKYRDSTDVLEEMKIDYPKDYKVQMWICYNYLTRRQGRRNVFKCVRRSEIYLSFLQKFI